MKGKLSLLPARNRNARELKRMFAVAAESEGKRE
jgi:hypothetical protein